MPTSTRPEPKAPSASILIVACLLLALVLMGSGCVMEDVESIIKILDPTSASKPKLVIEEIRLLPESPRHGETVAVSVLVQNGGRARSKAETLRLTMGEDTLATAEIPVLARGESTLVSFPQEIAFSAGVSVLKVGVDARSKTETEPRSASATTVVVGEPSTKARFTWDYSGNSYSIDLRIPTNDLDGLPKQRDVYAYEDYLDYISPADRTVSALAEILGHYVEAAGFESYDEVSFVLSFVQEMPYTSDLETIGDNYPKYPVETLTEGGGDCEDTSALFASIVAGGDAFNYGTCLIIVDEGHMAVGVTGKEGIGGTYFEKGGRRYYYCETTGKGYAIGELPDVFSGGQFKLIEIS